MTVKKERALVVLSGGQDSTTCLFWAKQHYERVKALVFDYGQRHQREIHAAYFVADMARVDIDRVELGTGILAGRSPLISDEPLEQYSDHDQMEKVIGNRVELTFVPMRNALFLTIAANRAICDDTYDIITGVCQADNANYPDCRQSFIDAQCDSINQALGLPLAWLDDTYPRGILIRTPLMDLAKHESIELALTMPGCYQALAYSHTAYDGSYPPTGKDHATVLRAHGFEQAGVPDPLIVRAYWEGMARHNVPETDNYKAFMPELISLANHIACIGPDPKKRHDAIMAALTLLETQVCMIKGVM